MLKSVVSYLHAFEMGCGVSFSFSRIDCFIDDKISSDHLSSYSRSPYVCHVRVICLQLKYNTVLSRWEELSVEDGAAMNLCLTHVDVATIYRAVEKDVLMMIWDAKCFVKNHTKPSPLHSVIFTSLGLHFFTSHDRLKPCR